MKRSHFKWTLVGSLIVGCLTTGRVWAADDVCAQPYQPTGTAWCDQDPVRYVGGTFCLAEPVGDEDSSTIDEEVSGAGVCLLGKFKGPTELSNVVDFVVSYEYPANPLLGPGGVYAPSLTDIQGSSDPTQFDGIYHETVPLDQEGIYDITVQLSVLDAQGVVQTLTPIRRRVLRMAKPHLTVSKARLDEGDLAVTEQPLPNDGSVDPDVAHILDIAAPTTINSQSPEHKIQFCIQSHDSESSAGSAVAIYATNQVTDDSASPSRSIKLSGSCIGTGSSSCTANPASDTFCPGGFSVNVPVAHGTNKIEFNVSNELTANVLANTEIIQVNPIYVDLKGPQLCVNYLDKNGTIIPNVDYKILLASEAEDEKVTVDVVAGPCGQSPEVLTDASSTTCDLNAPPDCGTASVCLQKQNDRNDEGSPRFVAMCSKDIGGKKHYQLTLKDLRYPINTVTIQAKDVLGNQNVETHSFGYGDVRPLFNAQGNLDIKNATVPKGFGAFLPAEYVTGELKELLLKVLNTKKFKNDVFLKLLDPRQPPDEEIACLRSIESKTQCVYDHLAGKDKIVQMKLFCEDGDCSKNIGKIDIPSIFLLNNNRIQLQLKISPFKGRGEIYTIEFADNDHDGIVDVEDDDADNDGICDRYVGALGKCTDVNQDGVCDEDGGISGTLGTGLNANHKCVLDKSVAKKDCPDVDAGDKNYWGCSDQNDDNDVDENGKEITDDHDLPGRLVLDPDFGTYIIPVRLDMKEIAMNLDVKISYEDGKMHLHMDNPPGRDMVEWIAEGSDPMKFDCGKQVSEIFQGGATGEVGNGKNVWIDTETCEGLRLLGSTDEGSFGQSTAEGSPEFLVAHALRKNQDVRRQFRCTFNAVLRCSTPSRAEAQMDKFSSQKVTGVSQELLDHNFHIDFYSPLNETEVRIDPTGVGVSGKGLLLPAGVTGKNDDAERNATDFLQTLPAEFKTQKFGPLSPTDPADAPPDPIVAASEMGSELNLALKEETINSTMHAVNTLLWDLGNVESDDHKSLDLTAKKLREDFDMGIPDIGNDVCKDKNGDTVDKNDWKCFPFPLNIENVLGKEIFKYVDFDGLAGPASERDILTPVILRNEMNPFMAPTVRIVSVSPVESWTGTSPSRPGLLIVELEIGLNHAPMSIFEEKVEDWQATTIRGTGEIKDWCDQDRFPGMNPTRCAANKKMPIVTLAASGRVFVTLLISIKDEGILRLEGGLSSVEKSGSVTVGEEMGVDVEKTYLSFTVIENNTVVADDLIAEAMKDKIDIILSKYVFGNTRDIRINAPAQLPLKDGFCLKFKDELCADKNANGVTQDGLCKVCECLSGERSGDDCDTANTLQDMWDSLGLDEFGIEGITLESPLLGVTGDEWGPTRYLTIGAGTKFEFTQ